MFKRTLAIALALACAFSLSGCLCSHEWSPASCDAPSTCTKCGKTEGSALEHIWIEAGCTEAKSCRLCGAVDGEPLGHDWTEADCENAAVCSRCAATEGVALGHDWQDATTEAPKTCTRCALTEGEPIVTDPRFKTANAAEILGQWVFETAVSPEAVGLAGFSQPLNMRFIVDFAPDGSFSESVEFADEESVMDAIIKYSIEVTYLQMEAQGISRETLDALIRDSYNTDMYEFVKSTKGALSINGVIDYISKAVNLGGVYYVEDGNLYTGLSWDAAMTPSDFKVDENGLWVAGFDAHFGAGTVFQRIMDE